MTEQADTQSWTSDPRSNEELFRFALTEADEDLVWNAVGVLRSRLDSSSVVEETRKLCASSDTRETQIGAGIFNSRADPRTNEKLLHIALIEEVNEDIVRNAIGIVQLRGGRDICEAACKLCLSENVHDRWVGADILGQLGEPADTFREESVTMLLGMLEHEQDPEVLNSIGVALGCRNDARAIQPLVKLKDHPDSDVRFGVVFGLMGHEDELAIQTLIELSTDAETSVRDWATTGLAFDSLIETDTPAICAALIARMADDDDVTRGEAMVGLARRHDLLVVEPLLTDLEELAAKGALHGSLLLEAAAEIGDPRLHSVLVRLQEAWEGEKDWEYRNIEDAIEKCRPAT